MLHQIRRALQSFRLPAFLLLALAWSTPAAGQTHGHARISETAQVIQTYPFSERDPVPILTRDERLYPYHAFQGYATESVPQEWKVVTLENDYIQVFVLPEVGGKVWGAVIKATGEEFIYRNEVMKFRNIALRGPWTSGGIEFNFGVIGHTPSTATPVDYTLLKNEDGSVSCVVGAMDLPSRTHWRVEIRLSPEKAYFETNVLWYNPTPTTQSYYNWMTAAAFARDDLRMYIPGNRFLGHPGESHAWPYDELGRYLPDYAQNRFGGHKSFHVVGELDEHFGGYYADDDYGFGHWSRHEEMPGQKLWLWALSRQGAVWEDLLTDTDGQYVEYQAGRQHVQYAPGQDINPIKEASFDPGSADRWEEIWFPVVGIGGMSDVSRHGVLHVSENGDLIEIGLNAFESVLDTVRVIAGGETVAEFPFELGPLAVFGVSIPHPPGAFEVVSKALGLRYATDRSDLALRRPFTTAHEAAESIPEVDQWVAKAQELIEARRFAQGRELLGRALGQEPWHRDGLVLMAGLDYRAGLVEDGLERIERVRQLDAYDPQANFVAGNLYRAAGSVVDAREAFGWAARSMAFRSAAYTQLADLALLEGDWPEAEHYASLALDYDRINLPALHARSIAARHLGTPAAAYPAAMLSIDPLNHAARAEQYLLSGSAADADRLLRGMRSEFPEQTLLEVAIGYANRGLPRDAARLLRAPAKLGPVAQAWLWYLEGAAEALPALSAAEVEFVFPYRTETLGVLFAAAEASDHWSWTYLEALNLWALGRSDEARERMTALGNRPDLSSFYISRAHMGGGESDLLRAQTTHGAGRLSSIHLIRHYQSKGRWDEALATSDVGRRQYPADFNLALLHARSLLYLDRPIEAAKILDEVHVLPSENASESHLMFEWAHVMIGMDLLDSRPDEAARHFRQAMEWPEHLGQGRPYDPDERLPRYLLGVASKRSGDTAAARAAFLKVVDASAGGTGQRNRLAVASLRALGRADEADAWAAKIPPRRSTTDLTTLDETLLFRALTFDNR